MNWLVLSYFLSLGTLSYQMQFVSDPVHFSTPNSFQSTLGIEALIAEHVFVGGSVQTYEKMTVDTPFSPWESLYSFKAGLRGWGFEIGYRHECDHLVLEGFATLYDGFWQNRDELYVSYTGHLKVF